MKVLLLKIPYNNEDTTFHNYKSQWHASIIMKNRDISLINFANYVPDDSFDDDFDIIETSFPEKKT